MMARAMPAEGWVSAASIRAGDAATNGVRHVPGAPGVPDRVQPRGDRLRVAVGSQAVEVGVELRIEAAGKDGPGKGANLNGPVMISPGERSGLGIDHAGRRRTGDARARDRE